MSEAKTAIQMDTSVPSAAKQTVLPYLSGGVPRALLYCLWIGGFIAAAFTAAFAVLGLIARGPVVVKLIAAAVSVLSVWLTLKESLGARKLLRNLPEGAEAISSVLSIRRVLLVAAAVLYGISILITAFSSRSGGILALLISALLGAALLVPFFLLTKDEVDLMDTVHAEMRSGEMVTDTLPPYRPFVILTVIAALGAIGAVWLQDSGALRIQSLPYELTAYTGWIFVYLIFSLIELSLMAANIRCFHKAHSAGAAETEKNSTLAVFGACMLFGAALYSAGSFPSFAAMQRWDIAFLYLLEAAGYALCGLALCKKGMKWLAAAGAAALIVQGVFDLVNLSGNFFSSPSLITFFSFASLVCFILACICILLRALSGRDFCMPCIILAAAAGVLLTAYRFAMSISLGLFHPSGYMTLLAYAGLIILARLPARGKNDAAPKDIPADENAQDTP